MWHRVIPEVCKKLENADIRYHADASSSLFVNGLDFEMDDFDVTVEWGCIEKARNLFQDFAPGHISESNPKQFHFEISGYKVDVMSYESETGIGPESERVNVSFADTNVWSKKPSFYLQ